MSADVWDGLSALLLGFLLAGTLASGWEAALRRPLGLVTLQTGDWRAVAGVPVVVLSAPILILRSTLAAAGSAPGRFGSAMLAAILAGGWSLACGRLVLDAARMLAGA